MNGTNLARAARRIAVLTLAVSAAGACIAEELERVVGGLHSPVGVMAPGTAGCSWWSRRGRSAS